jgi:hypothetical protein
MPRAIGRAPALLSSRGRMKRRSDGFFDQTGFGRKGDAAAALERCWLFWRGDEPTPYRLFAGRLAGTASCLGFFPNGLLRWLLIQGPPLHFPREDAFPLHLLLQDGKSLIDVAIADEYRHRLGAGCSSACIGRARSPGAHALGVTRSNVGTQIGRCPCGPCPADGDDGIRRRWLHGNRWAK